MAQVVCHWPLIAETRVYAQVTSCGVCVGQIGTETGFSQGSLVFPCQYLPTVALHTHISSGGRTVGAIVAAVQGQFHCINMNNIQYYYVTKQWHIISIVVFCY
jgi:hypothetical protein